jgi:hypothetical protein
LTGGIGKRRKRRKGRIMIYEGKGAFSQKHFFKVLVFSPSLSLSQSKVFLTLTILILSLLQSNIIQLSYFLSLSLSLTLAQSKIFQPSLSRFLFLFFSLNYQLIHTNERFSTLSPSLSLPPPLSYQLLTENSL